MNRPRGLGQGSARWSIGCLLFYSQNSNHVRLETIQIGALQGAIQIGAGIQIGALLEASAWIIDLQ